MSVRDVYSRWVDWVGQSTNAAFLPAFRTVGGDDIDAVSGTTIPIYAYLTNGWRIRPMESDHTLSVNDGVLLVDGGGDPFLDTIGSFTVRVNYQQPVQAITVATGGGGGGLTTEQANKLLEIWQRLGMDAANPVAQSNTQINWGGVTLGLSESSGTVTVTRTP